ncbi:MAG TPA: nickel insertion protein, partial [Actinomycetota bacterium]|nr:nickel insertion protein [Actinomycetota bacterium]
MSRLLFVDPIGGAAGDMLLAALMDAGAPEPPVLHAIESVLPGRFAVTTEEVRRGGFRARALRIEPLGGAPSSVEDRFSRLDQAVAEPIRAG